MAYNSNKGNQHMGDVQYEGDPNDVQIDFENDFVAIKTNGQQRFIVSGSFITSSVPLSCSAAITGQSLNTATTVIDSTHISSSLNLSASAIYIRGAELATPAVTSYINADNDRVIIGGSSTAQIEGASGLSFAQSKLAAVGQISASLGVTGSSLHTSTTIVSDIHVSSSRAVSASAFWANGVELTPGGGSPGGATATVQFNDGGSTFNGETTFVYDKVNNRVGIGTSNPHRALSVTGSASISGNLTVTGSVRGLIYHFTQHGWADGGSPPDEGWFPFYDLTDVGFSGGDYRHQMVAPFNGNLRKVILRVANDLSGGSNTIKLYRATNGTTDISSGAEVEAVSMTGAGAASATTFILSGTDHFAAGDVIGVFYTTTQEPGQSVATCVWEFEQE